MKINIFRHGEVARILAVIEVGKLQFIIYNWLMFCRKPNLNIGFLEITKR